MRAHDWPVLGSPSFPKGVASVDIIFLHMCCILCNALSRTVSGLFAAVGEVPVPTSVLADAISVVGRFALVASHREKSCTRVREILKWKHSSHCCVWRSLPSPAPRKTRRTTRRSRTDSMILIRTKLVEVLFWDIYNLLTSASVGAVVLFLFASLVVNI